MELELQRPTSVRTLEVYWYDDGGGVQAPQSWSLEIEQGGKWSPFPLYNTDFYGVALDQFNVVHPAQPVTVEKLRLRIEPKSAAVAGILEVVVTSEE